MRNSGSVLLYVSVALLGALFGFTSWWLQFSGYTATKIVAIDRVTVVGSLTPTPIIDTNFLMEFVRSAGFAMGAARHAGNPAAAHVFETASVLGRPAVNVRALPSAPPTPGSSAVEIKFASADPALARAVVEAAGTELLDFQAVKTASIVAALSDFSQMPKLATTDPVAARIASRTSLESAVSAAITKSQSGMTLETVVLPPRRPYLLMLLGALAAIVTTIMVRWREWLVGSYIARRDREAVPQGID